MKKTTVQFAVVTDRKGKVVEKIGKSSVLLPKIQYDGRKTQWFDDSKLLKTNKK